MKLYCYLILFALMGCSLRRNTQVSAFKGTAPAESKPASPITSFVLKDLTTGSKNYTNETSVNAIVQAPNATHTCVKTVNETPTIADSCWNSASTQKASVTSNSKSTLYAWVKDSASNISVVATASITHSSFPEFGGVTGVTNVGQGGKHLRVSWDLVLTPDNFDRYNIYVKSSGQYDFTKPKDVVQPATISSVSIGSLTDGTQHCFVVRAATSEIESNNTKEICATTIAGFTIPSSVTFGDSIFDTIKNYFNFTKSNIAKDEIITVVGKNDDGYTKTEESGLALTTWLFLPRAVKVKANGDVYIGDYTRIFKLNPNGTLTVIAGTRSSGFKGDGGPATQANFLQLSDFCFDPNDNIYIADSINYRVRKVDTNGIVTTVAGNGTTTDSGDNGPAVSAGIAASSGIACDSFGNVFISTSHRIRKISTSGMITTVAGTGTAGAGGEGVAAASAQISGPYGIVFDSSGNLYFSDSGNNRVKKIDGGGLLTTYAGTTAGHSGDGAAATSAQMYFPRGLSIDASNNIYIAAGTAGTYQAIRKVTYATGNISTLAGGVTSGFSPHDTVATSAVFGYAWGIGATPSGSEVYLTEIYDMSVRKIATDGKLKMVAGNRMSLYGSIPNTELVGGATSTRFYQVTSFSAIKSNGEMFLSDNSMHRVTKLDSSGNITAFAGTYNTPGASGDGAAATSATLTNPIGIAEDSKGNVYIADMTNNKVRKVATDGIITTFAGNGTTTYGGDGVAATSSGLNTPRSLVFDSSGNLFIADFGAKVIRKVTAEGIISNYAGNGTSGTDGDGGPATSAQISPLSLRMSPAGELHFLDNVANKIRKIKKNGVVETVVGNGNTGFPTPGSLATATNISVSAFDFDSSGSIYILSTSNDLFEINMIGSDGKFVNLYKMSSGWGGDGGHANLAKFRGIADMRLDAAGNIYLSDSYHGRIRFIKRTW